MRYSQNMCFYFANILEFEKYDFKPGNLLQTVYSGPFYSRMLYLQGFFACGVHGHDTRCLYALQTELERIGGRLQDEEER